MHQSTEVLHDDVTWQFYSRFRELTKTQPFSQLQLPTVEWTRFPGYLVTSHIQQIGSRMDNKIAVPVERDKELLCLQAG